MDAYVGTSGWSYDWNREGSLAWYVEHSGLNAIELNSSFYRFPSEETVAAWAAVGSGLRWSVKVNRSITHRHKFNEKAVEVWKRFHTRYEPLDDSIDFYLFQAPPMLKDLDRILEFAGKTGLDGRCAVEIRNPKVLGDDEQCRRLQDHVVLVSVDSPDFHERIFPGDVVYLRMHGREDWYRHDYSGAELDGIKDRIVEIDPQKAYVFFNNDHSMLENARQMIRRLRKGPRR
jgi:uncharacterized protein YecE (DUF72 family)